MVVTGGYFPQTPVRPTMPQAQGGRVVDGQVARRGRDGVGGIETAGPGAAGQDDDEIGADRGELADDVAPRAIAKGGEDDDGGNAD